ncbi:MAG: cbb3-type cytochrome c oxidase subunit I, partial [Candidatus Kapabacteria bacterium]|nr:cbb3-type cytochrome c oxidase subunit I [Candidatus Kapabacteria bacterium]
FYLKNSLNLDKILIEDKVKKEIKTNNYQANSNSSQINEAQIYAISKLRDFYINKFGNSPQKENGIQINNNEEINQLADFFFWGAWVCKVDRPGRDYSYTHNWPYDKLVGNTPTPPVILWSVIGSFTLFLVLGLVLFFYGQLDKLNNDSFVDKSNNLMTSEAVQIFTPTDLQKSTYKYFFIASLLFLIQVLSGVLTVHDFVGFVKYFGYNISLDLPINITRSWHVILSVYWISTCWIGASLFILPFFGDQDSKQTNFSNLIFWLLILVVGGTFTGILFGQSNILSSSWYWIGNQGWEFVEMGKVWQIILFIAFLVWTFTIYRGLKKHISLKEPWALPNWLLYATACISILFISGFIATPKTNFVVADFWRWCVIHMWAEAFFEVFTTIIVGTFMVIMGLVSTNSIIRVLYIGTILFLGSGLLGISHNFYWNAKPEATMALGSVFSTLQVIPLILLTLEAWRFKRMPELAIKKNGNKDFGMEEVFLFLLGVNFWNFFGAGVLGFIINLPIVNYFEHGTYLTVNHGHAALMGVYGNLSVSAIFFCGKLMTKSNNWNTKIAKQIFWSLNIGLILMVILDLFPAGIYQFNAVITSGLWYARSANFIDSSLFQSFTWLRIIGGAIFLLGGVIPLCYLITKSFINRKA